MLSAISATTRKKILDAGLNLFSSKGFSSTTTRELAQEAGVAEVTLFRHFPTKEKLLEDVIDNFSMVPALKSIQSEINGIPCDKALESMAEFLLDSMITRKEWIVLMHNEVQRNPEKLLTIYHTYLDHLFDAIADHFRFQQKVGLMRNFEPDLAARAFYGMIFCYFNMEEVLRRKDYRPTANKDALSAFVTIFSQGAMA